MLAWTGGEDLTGINPHVARLCHCMSGADLTCVKRLIAALQ
jgi:hypothetical protein